ncbi:hypothetical protein EJB05_27794, partial [Eragrostis curvula]
MFTPPPRFAARSVVDPGRPLRPSASYLSLLRREPNCRVPLPADDLSFLSRSSSPVKKPWTRTCPLPGKALAHFLFSASCMRHASLPATLYLCVKYIDGNPIKEKREHYSGNGLNGSIPTTLGKLNNLVNLDLEDNLLSGTILPASLGINTLKNMSGCMWVQPDRISILIFGKSNQPCELRTSEEFAE